MTLRSGTDRGLLEALLGDGRLPIVLCGFCLLLAGGFAVFQSATGHFLPHDVAFLEMTADELCGIAEGRVVYFMFHDRVSFGGTLIGIGVIYMWLAGFPLRKGEAWAWWTLLLSGLAGFASFLTYLGFAYLDTWHGVATVFLFPLFLAGVVRSFEHLGPPRHVRCVLQPGSRAAWNSRFGLGRLCLVAMCLGLAGAGLTIMMVGMTVVFVPQDLEYMRLRPADLDAVNPRLVPLIAHDRAGFGGGLCSGGLALLLCTWCGRPSRSLWQALGVAGTAGFATAIGVHPAIGYTDVVHLAPACAGAGLFMLGMVLTRPAMVSSSLALEAGVRASATRSAEV